MNAFLGWIEERIPMMRVANARSSISCSKEHELLVCVRFSSNYCFG